MTEGWKEGADGGHPGSEQASMIGSEESAQRDETQVGVAEKPGGGVSTQVCQAREARATQRGLEVEMAGRDLQPGDSDHLQWRHGAKDREARGPPGMCGAHLDLRGSAELWRSIEQGAGRLGLAEAGCRGAGRVHR